MMMSDGDDVMSDDDLISDDDVTTGGSGQTSDV